MEVLEAPHRWVQALGGPLPGKYEVKRLTPRKGGRSYDPRFKTSGARGSRIYGRHGALVKAAALELEEDELLWQYMRDAGTAAEFGLMLQDAFTDRHGHNFRRAFDAVCRDMQGAGLKYVDRYLESPITSAKILSGYEDLDGLFIIRGDTYTLIKRDKITQHIAFDSFGSEGLKLRLLDLGVVSDKQQRSGKR